jgi:2-oxoglutarate dehydrogenase E1 component
MPGQGVIVGVGSIDYPAEFQGADEHALGSLGISKVVTVTSTYDHRIIQGAESGMFLKRVHELLMGEHAFYEQIFQSLGVPYEAVKWHSDVNPINREDAMLHKQMQVATLIRVHRVRGHLIADLDPLRWRQPELPQELDPATYGLTIWDLDREFLTGGVAGVDRMSLGDLLGGLPRDAHRVDERLDRDLRTRDERGTELVAHEAVGDVEAEHDERFLPPHGAMDDLG